jgi:AcrR family transcriptional regulator
MVQLRRRQAVSVAERKDRERAERERRITATARQIAADEGWSAVTIRRLADAYSQPVIYSHFSNRDAIVAAVAVEAFQELGDALRDAAGGSTRREQAMQDAGVTYLAFAREHPALYEAMFAMPTGLHFATADTRPELKAALAALKAVVTPVKGDGELATETFWAALHGLAELERSGRIRAEGRDDRIGLVIDGFL